MEEINSVALLSAFGGAVIGALASIITIFISSHFENKRHLDRLAYEAAIEDHKEACAIAKRESTGAPIDIAPLTAYIHFHIEYMKLVRKGKLTSSSLEKLKKERDDLFPKPK